MNWLKTGANGRPLWTWERKFKLKNDLLKWVKSCLLVREVITGHLWMQMHTLYRRCGFTCMMTVLPRHPCCRKSSTSLSTACTNSASRISEPQTCRSTFVYGCSFSHSVMAVKWLTLNKQQRMPTVMLHYTCGKQEPGRFTTKQD
jgi:hypothetical protein